jgi:hypothetical protein
MLLSKGNCPQRAQANGRCVTHEYPYMDAPNLTVNMCASPGR